MAEDIKIVTTVGSYIEGDLKFENGDLVRENGLTTAVIISLFTDRRADEDDQIDNPDDRRGWWGDLLEEDDQIGSKLWQLERAKTTPETMTKAKQYIKDALQWMLDDGVCSKINVTMSRGGIPGNDILGFEIQIMKNDGNNITYKFDDLWSGQFEEVS